MAPKEPQFFATPPDLRQWFEKNHKKETELIVGYYKTGTKKPSITWPQSVDEALCFGWIDGVRRSIDEESYMIRFTPRKAKSIWSAVNINKVEALVKAGLMKPEGIAAFEKREAHNSKIYSFEQEKIELDAVMEKTFKASKQAWENFQALPGSYKKAALWWVISAKQEATRQKRLQELIAASAEKDRVKHLKRFSG